MTLKTQIASDVSTLFFNADDFAQSGVYNFHGSTTSKAISLILDKNMKLSATEYGAAAMATVWVKNSDIAAPAIYDTILTGGVTYRVLSLVQGDGYVWQLSVEADQRQRPGQV
jgi:hypothetical protein